MERKTVRRSVSCFRLRQVSETGFQRMRSAGSAAGASESHARARVARRRRKS